MNSRQLYFRLLGHVRPYWRVLGTSILMLTLLALTEPLFPALMKPLLDDGFNNRNQAVIQWVPLAMVGLFLLRGLLSFVSSYTSSWVANRVVTDLRNLMFEHLVHLPTPFFDHHSSGALGSKVAYDVNNVTGAATQALTVIVRDSITVLALMGWLLWLDWRLTLTTVFLIPFITVIVRFFNRRLRRLSGESQRSMARITHTIEEAVTGHKVVKVFTAEEYEKRRFRQANEHQRGVAMRSTVAASAVTPLVQVLASLSVAAVVAIALNSPGGDTATAGGFVSFLTAMLMLLPPTKRLTDMTSTIQRGLAAAESVFELIDEPPEPQGSRELSARLSGEIHFRNLHFAYPGTERPALNGFSLDVRRGENVALVGRSGSGKTTVTNLLTRFYELGDGDILLDGHSIHALSLTDLRGNIALVSQDVRLFNDTIAGNVAYSQADADREHIREALEAAHAWEFVATLPEGMDTLIGQNGVKLSGGQRQRIAIARAFFKDAPILILDEATSALDTESERNVQEALERLMKERTTLVIAHRLSTIEKADRIVVMEGGEIAEIGTHTDLLEAGGLYAHYYRLQFSETGQTTA